MKYSLLFGLIVSSIVVAKDISRTSTYLDYAASARISKESHKERCRRLEKLGLMTSAGRAVLPDMSEKSFVIDSDVLKILREDSQTWENFQKFPSLYQRVRIDYIQRTKRHKTMYENRLKNFTEKTKKNIMFGEWNDRGRLLDY